METPPLYIHAGAHRTGTSSLQMCLHENRAALQQAGYALAYPGRDGIPSGSLALRLPRPKDGVRPFRVEKARETLRMHAQGKPLILSEENIPGRMMHFMKGQFYPAAEKRCRVLRRAWEGTIAHVLFVVRPYDELFVSGYRKRAEDNPVPDFDDLRANYMQMNRGWPALIRHMRDILRPRRFTVITYAQRGPSARLLHRLAPDLPTDLAEPARLVNLSATDAALIELQRRYRAGEKLRRSQWKEVVAAHAGDRADLGFAAFSEKEQRVWADRYARDLDRIADMDGISFG